MGRLPCHVEHPVVRLNQLDLKSWFQYLLRDLAQFCNLENQGFLLFLFIIFSNEKSNNSSLRRLLWQLNYIQIIYKVIRTSPLCGFSTESHLYSS